MDKELQIAKDLAMKAGEILLRHYGGTLQIQWKGKNDPVTAADREASRFIVEGLRLHFPNDAILCEEEQDDLQRLSNARVWFVDPMDGTKEFINRNGEFAVMIGLAIDGDPHLGVVYRPTEELLYFASHGSGAYRVLKGQTLRLHVSSVDAPADATMVLSRSHPSAATEAIRNLVGIRNTIRLGSIGLKVGLLCEGHAHVYVQGRGTSLWDTCGPEAILREAGGKMTDKYGKLLSYSTPEVRNLNGVIATNGILHETVVEAAVTITKELHS